MHFPVIRNIFCSYLDVVSRIKVANGGVIFTVVIWVIALLLLFYAQAMDKRGVLN
jgi:hypothetical protein